MIPKHLITLFVLLLSMGCSASLPTAAPPDANTPSSDTVAAALSQPTAAVEISTATAEPSVAATTRPTETEGTATPVLSAMNFHEQNFSSPDGKWSVKVQVALPAAGRAMYYTRMVVDEVEGPRNWTVLDRWSNWGLGYTVPEPFHWSKDGTALYYTNVPVPDGCPVFVNGSDLVRLDLTAGHTEQVVPSVGLWLSLAPDEKTLAYIGYGGRGLVIRDAKGNERELPLDYGSEPYQAGKILWSPDQKTLVYTVARRPCAGDWAKSTSLIRVDAATLEQTVLVREDTRLLTTVEWETPGRVLLSDNDGRRWWMDAQTGEMTPE
ncbi:MAG: hypothetical protein IT331_01790 [Anaerolineae bacterium]|nr:hypothetical protein [Anaerolineae bacterium]